MFTWQNRAGVKWDLTLVEEVEPGTLMFDVGEDCPYYQNGYTTANLYYNIDSTEEVEIEGPWRELFKKLGGGPDSTTTTSTSTSATSTVSTSAPSSDTGATTTVLLSTSVGCLLVIVVIAIVASIICKQFKKKRGMKEQVVKEEDNPVYQEYQFVGENYERQYSTHEAVDYNDYYE